jgi:hypothetical protein
MKLALPMQGYKPHEVGAGFVTGDLTAKLFGDYRKDSGIIVVKAIKSSYYMEEDNAVL